MSDTALMLVTAALFVKAFTRLMDFKLLDVFLCISAISIIATLYVNGVL